jgi:hypothetical protein
MFRRFPRLELIRDNGTTKLCFLKLCLWDTVCVQGCWHKACTSCLVQKSIGTKGWHPSVRARMFKRTCGIARVLCLPIRWVIVRHVATCRPLRAIGLVLHAMFEHQQQCSNAFKRGSGAFGVHEHELTRAKRDRPRTTQKCKAVSCARHNQEQLAHRLAAIAPHNDTRCCTLRMSRPREVRQQQ